MNKAIFNGWPGTVAASNGGCSAVKFLLLSFLLFCFSTPSLAEEKAETQTSSKWEFSFANGLFFFKHEFNNNQPSDANEQQEEEESRSGYLGEFNNGEPAVAGTTTWFSTALDSKLYLDISGVIARAKLIQTFRNTTGDWVDAKYQFPLPEDAAVDHLLMRIGAREIVGEILPKQKARTVFASAKSAGQKASLVEQQKANMFTTRIANIAPGEEISVEIGFQYQVQLVEDEFRLRFPTTFTPQFNWQQKPNEAIQWLNDTHQNEAPKNFEVDLRLFSGAELASIDSQHFEVAVEKYSDFYQINFVEPQIANRDFELTWRYPKYESPQLLHFKESHPEGEFGLLMLLPSTLGATNEMEESVIPRNVTFVIDTSSSMGGASIRQAKTALLHGIDTLSEHDSFNLVQFNSTAGALWTLPKPSNHLNREAAKQFIEALYATGGTNMYAALDMALASQVQGDEFSQIVFITDGAVGYENELLQLLEQRLDNHRLFTVGIGSAPNSYFMTEAARVGKGTFTYIGSPAHVKQRMEALFNQLKHPQLSDISVQYLQSVEQFPELVPDLYHGEPLLLTYFSSVPLSQITLTGRVNYTPWEKSVFLPDWHETQGIRHFWAQNKIESLLQSQRRFGNRNNHVDEITQLAMKYHLVSPYTSLVAVEKMVSNPNPERSQLHSIPLARPAGSLPQTATSAMFSAFLAAIFALLAMSVLVIKGVVSSNSKVKINVVQ